MDGSEEDWSVLKRPSVRNDRWDPIKFIPLRPDPNWYLTLGAEIRSFYQVYRNYNWGLGPQDGNGYYLNRLLASADFHFGRNACAFFEVKSGLEYGRNGGPRAVQDEDKLDTQQLLFQLKAYSQGDQPLIGKIGRQELQYGEGALLDVRRLDLNDLSSEALMEVESVPDRAIYVLERRQRKAITWNTH